MKISQNVAGIKSASEAGWQEQITGLISRPTIIALLLAVVTLLVYWPVRQYEFLGIDDPLYYTQSDHVLGGLTRDGFVWAFTTGAAANWHPLAWLSLMLDAELFGNQPAGPHLVNLLFHLANTVLVFVLLRRLTAAVWRSALVAALFALHPLHVESVAWVAERKDLLCAFFSLLALLFHGWYAELANHQKSGRAGPYCLSLFFFALALMSKPMAVTVPFLLLLLDWWPLNRTCSSRREEAPFGNRKAKSEPPHVGCYEVHGAPRPKPHIGTTNPAIGAPSTASARRCPQLAETVLGAPVHGKKIGVRNFIFLLVEKIPFFVIAATTSVVTFLVQKSGGAVGSAAAFPFSLRIENAFVSYARYLDKTLWPATLANPYPHPDQWPPGLVLLSVLLFGALCVVAIASARKWPFIFTGWFWFAGMLVPVIGLVQVGTQAMADRYMYLPSIGLFVVFVWGAGAVGARQRAPKLLLAVISLAVVAACAVRTQAQLAYWHNDGTLFTHALAVTKNNSTACVDLGSWYLKNGQNQAALQEYQAASEMRPTDPLVLYDLGNAFASLGDNDAAIASYRRALDLAPGRPNILNNLGCALMAQGRLPEAITNFEAALAVNPDFAYAHNSLGTAFAKQDRLNDAAEQYAMAVKMAPGNPGFIENLGDALVRVGKLDAAAACYQQALQLAPDNQGIAAKLKSLGH